MCLLLPLSGPQLDDGDPARRLSQREQHTATLVAFGRHLRLCREDDVLALLDRALRRLVDGKERHPGEAEDEVRSQLAAQCREVRALSSTVHDEEVAARAEPDGAFGRRHADPR